MPLEHPLNVPIADRLYRLVETYVYEWEKSVPGTELVHEYRITVPKGYVYDGASVPRIVWTVSGLTPDGLIRAAALVHDWIYDHKGHLPEGSQQYKDADGQWPTLHVTWNRKAADRIFGRIMREAEVSKLKRRAAYRAVRLFGWIGW